MPMCAPVPYQGQSAPVPYQGMNTTPWCFPFDSSCIPSSNQSRGSETHTQPQSQSESVMGYVPMLVPASWVGSSGFLPQPLPVERASSSRPVPPNSMHSAVAVDAHDASIIDFLLTLAPSTDSDDEGSDSDSDSSSDSDTTEIGEDIIAEVCPEYTCTTCAPDEICTICLDGFAYGQELCSVSACTHRFHKECLVPWLKRRPRCPNCRQHVLEPAGSSDSSRSVSDDDDDDGDYRLYHSLQTSGDDAVITIPPGV
jgi:hypothetical protein